MFSLLFKVSTMTADNLDYNFLLVDFSTNIYLIREMGLAFQ